MSEAALQLDHAPGRLRVGPVSSRLPSKLLGSLFQLVDINHRLTVLEIGTALPETVDFFAQYKCRLHFVDLFDEPFVREQADLSEAELRHGFEEQLRVPPGTKLDLCLLWDFLSYLDDPALRAFNSALRPWVHGGTRAHGFGVHHLALKLEHQQYGIIDRETLIIRSLRHSEMPNNTHSQVENADMLNCLAF